MIFQASIDRSEVPKDWHSANIVAVYKKGDKSCPANYRLVCLTSVPCKMLEYIMYRHVMIHCEDYKILVDFQYSFRNKRSYETQLISNTRGYRQKQRQRNECRHTNPGLQQGFRYCAPCMFTKEAEVIWNRVTSGLDWSIANWLSTASSTRWKEVRTSSSTVRCTSRYCAWATNVPPLHQWHW